MMKYQLKGMQSVAIGCVSVVMLCLIGWQGDVEAASDCYLKCFTTGEGTKICVVEGHRLYEKITIRAENGDQCFSSITQARSAGFVVVGESASKPAEAQRRPKVIPAAPVESPEALPDETPEPAPDTPPETAPLETGQAVEAVAPESPEASEVPEDVDDEIPEEAPPTPMSDEELSPAENEKQALIAKLTDDSLDMAEREQAYQQLMNHPDLTEEEKQGLEFTWNFIHEGGAQDFVIEVLKSVIEMLKSIVLGPIGIGILLVLVFLIVCGWVLFSKANVPGWLFIIPIVNLFFLVKISGKSIWWFILFFVPIVQIIAALMVSLGLAERFGKGAFMGIVLFFLPFIGLPILAFTGEYQG